MPTILLRYLHYGDLAHLAVWFADAETRRRMAGMLLVLQLAPSSN